MRRLSFSLLSVAFVLCCTPSALRAQDLNANYARDPKQPIDQHYTDQILKYTTDKSLHLAAGGLPACLEDRAHAGEGAGRCLRRAGHAALRRGRLQVLPHAGGGEPAREGVHHRPHGRRPRDDRRGHRRSRAAGQRARRTTRGWRSLATRAPSAWTTPRPAR